ncbi:colanic acid/amylovoran biosynthesis glycosyltransferase [Tistlia consotensis]|uniref:Colanic acid/amylovoran biosynthesis glycosyltransferase n=1 Tax=Tistlia consotensis USBA 355 TaxID=560819 RepID=A0A1Y6CEN3_9PROT|nr:glycosyltransferase [Tistlia consotensis]SMF58948.1 colanic acid/amylovoran biosynthesis glycosyltransferase [Tistlia consotensis USBA 355]SNR64031.1 colanic acid/amylovoran biosynthesis glycosyltransferase [Tistlia consotensis]
MTSSSALDLGQRPANDLVPPEDRQAPPRHGPPLRIAVFVSEFPALSETFVLRQVVGLRARGHEVTVFADQPRAEPLTHPDFLAHGLAERTRYLGMPASRPRRAATAAGALLRHGLSRPTVLPRTLDPLRFGRDAINLRMLFWAHRLIAEPPFDVLHCHFGPVGAMVEQLRAIGAVQGRLVTTFHGADLTVCLRRQPDAYRRLLRRGDLFLPISDYLAGRLARLGCPAERIGVLRMGVDLQRFAVRPRRRAPGEPLRVVTVGRLVDKKGVADGLAAVAEAARRGIDLAYTIIGDGPLRGSLEAQARALGIERLVGFRGWQVQEEILAALYRHDVLLAPSVTAPDGDQEGIPVTLMEAMATGMPVVSTRHSGIPELVENGVSGLLADEHDAGALANALTCLATAPHLAETMGVAARARVAALHDADRLDDQLDRHLDALAGAAS